MTSFKKESKVSWSICPKYVPAEGTTRFRLVSYNMLAQSDIQLPYFSYTPPGCLDWMNRSKATLTLLRELRSDFLCLQELDAYDFYKTKLETYGYYSVYIQRDGKEPDGCGIFYKHNVAELLIEDTIKYNDLLELCHDDDDLGRDCVGIMGAFRLRGAPANHVVIVANTHIFWDPWLSHVQFAQAKYLTQRLAEFKTLVSKKFGCVEPSMIVAGDFNSVPNSMVYQYLISSHPDSKLWIENNEVVVEVEYFKEPAPMALGSVYAVANGREPKFTYCNQEFEYTLDYIFFSPSRLITPISVLKLPDSTDSADVIGGLPNFYHPSDHLPLAIEFEIRKIKYA
ncbi:hypothetical protein QYF36_012527 [Acer negundo]|nr:hypothetical protein QYF36_012527 [Acer negundo]